ncbi:isochorismatase family protein [Kribbella sp. NPDC004875]|uniref:isochorismatase family protein n=1 Tax=Kribbella sp. NPDC004875 TaxID=3364107 RepID=UPI00368D88E1
MAFSPSQRRKQRDTSGRLPDQQPINPTSVNTWEDRRVVDAVENTAPEKLIIAGLWTEFCVAMPAIHALDEEYDVFVVTDASGGVSTKAHDLASRLPGSALAVGELAEAD